MVVIDDVFIYEFYLRATTTTITYAHIHVPIITFKCYCQPHNAQLKLRYHEFTLITFDPFRCVYAIRLNVAVKFDFIAFSTFSV